MSFLPTNYEKPNTGSNYLRLQQGDNKFRILSNSITGWEFWTTDKKPIRSKNAFETTPNIQVDKDGKTSIKHFWAFVCWDYKESKIKILEITQSSIQDAIINYYKDDAWGDPKLYDFNIKKSGEKLDTEYQVIAIPPKPLHPDIVKLYSETKINLEALYDGKDPFTQTAEAQAVADANALGADDEISSIPF